MPRTGKKKFKSHSPDIDIREYFREVRHKYPNLTLNDFERVIRSAFLFFRRTIEAGKSQIINIKYFGKFIPFRKLKRDETNKDAPEESEQNTGHNELPSGEV